MKLDIESKIAGILHTVNDSEADAVKDGGTSILYGKEYITENLLGLDFKITPFSFFRLIQQAQRFCTALYVII